MIRRALTKAHLKAACKKSFDTLRADHIREHQRLFNRVQLDLGITEAAELPTDQRPAKFLEGRRSASRRALFPVRPLPADFIVARRDAACKSAGTLE